MSGASQPLLPAPKEGDPEDVSWALQTADALWKRGEYADAVSWIRKAANAASEAEADMRVIELAKAAAELSALVEAFGARAPEPVAAEPLLEPRIPSGVGIDIRNGTRMRVPAIGTKAISMLRWVARYLITGRSGI